MINYEEELAKFQPSLEIDEAEGSNWWSVLYPEFFNVDFEDFSEVKFEWYFFD